MTAWCRIPGHVRVRERRRRANGPSGKRALGGKPRDGYSSIAAVEQLSRQRRAWDALKIYSIYRRRHCDSLEVEVVFARASPLRGSLDHPNARSYGRKPLPFFFVPSPLDSARLSSGSPNSRLTSRVYAERARFPGYPRREDERKFKNSGARSV